MERGLISPEVDALADHSDGQQGAEGDGGPSAKRNGVQHEERGRAPGSETNPAGDGVGAERDIGGASAAGGEQPGQGSDAQGECSRQRHGADPEAGGTTHQQGDDYGRLLPQGRPVAAAGQGSCGELGRARARVRARVVEEWRAVEEDPVYADRWGRVRLACVRAHVHVHVRDVCPCVLPALGPRAVLLGQSN